MLEIPDEGEGDEDDAAEKVVGGKEEGAGGLVRDLFIILATGFAKQMRIPRASYVEHGLELIF